VYPIPDEEVLFGPHALQEPVVPAKPDLGHFYIHVGGRTYFLKPSGIIGGQAASELITNDLGRAAGFHHWPWLRVFPNPDEPEEARVVMNVIPGVKLAHAIREVGDIGTVLAHLDPQSVADTLTLEMATLAGDRHDENYMISGDQLVGIDYQTSFDPGWRRRYGPVALGLPEELLQTRLRRELLSAILNQRGEVLQRVCDELIPKLGTGSTLDQVLEAIEGRFLIVEGLLQLEEPTLGDLLERHPDRSAAF
jgi:hypothetical protein